MGEIRIMNSTGDAEVAWRTAVQPEVDAAQKEFLRLRRDGYLLFRINPETGEGEQVIDFDPGDEHIRAFQPMVGG